MHREVLKDGNWVDLRDADEVTQRGRRGIQAIATGLKDLLKSINVEEKDQEVLAAQMDALDLTEEQADAMIRLQEATIVAFIAGWSRPEPVPTLATIGDLSAGLYDELAALTAPKGARLALDTSPSLEVDPKDLSGSSDSLVGLSRDETDSGTESIPESPSVGVPIATGS